MKGLFHMTRVDPRLSTPHLSTSLNNPAEPTATEAVDTSRRRFLSRCRGDRWRRCACNGSPAVQSGRRRRLAPDPIIEVIEAHKAAHAKVVSWVDRYGKLENELPPERRRSSNEEIVETDDPRWIETERELGPAWDAENSAA